MITRARAAPARTHTAARAHVRSRGVRGPGKQPTHGHARTAMLTCNTASHGWPPLCLIERYGDMSTQYQEVVPTYVTTTGTLNDHIATASGTWSNLSMVSPPHSHKATKTQPHSHTATQPHAFGFLPLAVVLAVAHPAMLPAGPL